MGGTLVLLFYIIINYYYTNYIIISLLEQTNTRRFLSTLNIHSKKRCIAPVCEKPIQDPGATE